MAMLGEQIAEEQGQITGRRVLPSDGYGPKVEVSFQARGTILGYDATDLGTYWSAVQDNGALYGEGQGVVMTTQGDIVQWVGAGRGRFTEDGGVSFRGAVYYQTTSERLARLNGIAAVYEHEASADDRVVNKLWEWK
jgi:hypothetical protein